MAIHDAIYAVALHWYGLEQCSARGERLTPRAASNIREIAASFQIYPEHTASQLGFDFDADSLWPLEAIRIAKNCVRRYRGAEQVQRLCTAIADLTIAEIEGYSEAYP